jgi:hypothetical protein
MKIKQYLSKSSVEMLEQCSLPVNLKDQLLHLYPSIIKGFIPDPKHLRSFVCHPLKSHLRLQCTMKRIDQEQEHTSKLSSSSSSSTTTTTTTTSNLSGATYVLYLEYLGGLIPLLTAKRISKICPDFIIFDPHIKTTDLSLLSSQKIYSPKLTTKKYFLSSKSRSNTCHDIRNMSQSKLTITTNRSGLIGNRNSIYVAETDVLNGHDTMSTDRTNMDSSTDNDSCDDDNQLIVNLQDKRTRKTLINKSMKHKHVR